MPRNRSLPKPPFCAFSLLWAGLALLATTLFSFTAIVFSFGFSFGEGRVSGDPAGHSHEGYRTSARLCLSAFHFHMFSVDRMRIDTLASWMACSHRQPITAESPSLMATETHSYIDCTGTNDDTSLMHLMPDACSESCHSSLWANTRDVKNLFLICTTGMLEQELCECVSPRNRIKDFFVTALSLQV